MLVLVSVFQNPYMGKYHNDCLWDSVDIWLTDCIMHQ
uniref:Uncharacterized protein n=1 Tax=Schistosoma mansoni TaxID=6183 RepID=A0AA82N571_SCHMA